MFDLELVVFVWHGSDTVKCNVLHLAGSFCLQFNLALVFRERNPGRTACKYSVFDDRVTVSLDLQLVFHFPDAKDADVAHSPAGFGLNLNLFHLHAFGRAGGFTRVLWTSVDREVTDFDADFDLDVTNLSHAGDCNATKGPWAPILCLDFQIQLLQR
jgi:hypothetical protein